MSKFLIGFCILVLCLVTTKISDAQADVVLYGMAGEEGGPAPGGGESYWSISETDPISLNYIQQNENGGDGASIAYNSSDGQMYHFSGRRSSMVMESFNPSGGPMTDIPITHYDTTTNDQVMDSTYDSSSGNFYVTDKHGRLSSVTPGGLWTYIDEFTDQDPSWNPKGDYRGISTKDATTLYMGERRGNNLVEYNLLTGMIDSTLELTSTEGTLTRILGLTTHPLDGVLYGITSTDVSSASLNRFLVTIDTQTGVATTVGHFSYDSNFATIAFAVPEPSLGLLLGISLVGLVGVGAVRKLKNKTVTNI